MADLHWTRRAAGDLGRRLSHRLAQQVRAAIREVANGGPARVAHLTPHGGTLYVERPPVAVPFLWHAESGAFIMVRVVSRRGP